MLGFTKRSRLLNACDYQAVFAGPTARASHPNILLLARSNDLGCPRLGLVIAKKNVRQACQRNRIKRVIRESFRHQQDYIGSIDVIVLARRNLDQLSNPELFQLLSKQWRRLHKSQNKHDKADRISAQS
ncbi:ribonuclease P protein component [Halioxenophilus aromaticivorans]|uniref:Ribonuclease P protein component n=1 Tax=Halioxenophilus aromaticivorans TaxID=1306992 RepID=A0AAV3U8H0_9ALTE